MNIVSVRSKNGVSVRITEERWKYIVLMHPSLNNKKSQVLNSVKNPDYILKGKAGEMLAVLILSNKWYLVVVYKEEVNDGFIITAFETTDVRWLFKKEKIWSKHS